MADIEVVIKMDENYFHNIKETVEDGGSWSPYLEIANGTPLPKGYGRDSKKGKMNNIPIPKDATNGDMLLAMFDDATVYGIDEEKDSITICIDNNFYQKFSYKWWNTRYRESEK